MSLLQRLQEIRSNKIIYNRLQRRANPKPAYSYPTDCAQSSSGELSKSTHEKISDEAALRFLELQEELKAAEEESRAQTAYLPKRAHKR